MNDDSNNFHVKSLARSCLTCSKAKAKCVRLPDSAVCERCTRLKKECHMKEPLHRKKKPVKTTRTAQLEKLENKIEHLVNALSTQQTLRTADFAQPSPSGAHRSPPHDGGLCAATQEVLSGLCNSAPGAPASPEPSTDGEKAPPEVSLDEAELLLDRYRQFMSTGLPFVIIPENITARSLQEQKPVLLRAVTTVALFSDLPRQKALLNAMSREVGERMITRSEKSIDLLQGILVMLAWFHPHVFWSQQTTNFLHLAMALVNDMGIDRVPNQGGNFKTVTTRAVHGPSLVSKVHTLEERRALLGVFYLTSLLSSTFKKVSTMPFSSYMEDGLNALQQASEYDCDTFLVQIIRVQRVIESINSTNGMNVPSRAYIKALQADILHLQRTDPCQGDNTFLRLTYLSAESMTWELALIDLQENPNRSLATHLENLYQCVAYIKSYMDVFFSLPASAYYLLPFPVFAQFAHVFICLTKLASLEIEGWDLKSLNEELDFSKVIDTAVSRFEEATRCSPHGIRVNNDSFLKWSAKIQWMKQIYQAKFWPGPSGSATQEGQHADRRQGPRPPDGTGLQQFTPPDDPVLSADFFGYLDDNFWDSFAGDFEMPFPGAEVT